MMNLNCMQPRSKSSAPPEQHKPAATRAESMKRHSSHCAKLLAFALALAGAFGCTTLQYRDVQSRFDNTVRADNERFMLPFVDVAGRYEAVANELTPDYIARLEPELRPNAWTLRAVSQWRAGALTAAGVSSTEGLAELDRLQGQSPHLEHSRDSIILTMVPGLVEDSRLRQRFLAGGAGDIAANYGEYAARFQTALRALMEARSTAGPATPKEVIYYWAYQCWRVLSNWLFIIGQLPLEAQAQANAQADLLVKRLLADAGLADVSTLPDAIQFAESLLPPEHPYRQLMALERQR
jgi:hypothetical protein